MSTIEQIRNGIRDGIQAAAVNTAARAGSGVRFDTEGHNVTARVMLRDMYKVASASDTYKVACEFTHDKSAFTLIVYTRGLLVSATLASGDVEHVASVVAGLLAAAVAYRRGQ